MGDVSGHPSAADNPHVQAAVARTVVGVNDDGNEVTTTVIAPEGGEQPSPEPEDGTGSSTSSTPVEPSEKSTETGSPSPAPTTEPLSNQDPTTSGTAPSTDGAGTEAPTSDEPVQVELVSPVVVESAEKEG
jgi:hypothetical protein